MVSMYNKQKPEKKRKGYEKQNTENEDNHGGEGPSRKLTRLNTKLKNFSEICFFCDKENPQLKLHKCIPLSVNNRVKAFVQ